ncbi:trypsin-like serine peptidase [Streptomyces sp. NPDC059037]|uniref:trypsin-like serine peptidase n=1 Tax=Streptomyces sp. NPDC059037 TaxID=3346710 RepID=UPI003694FE89
MRSTRAPFARSRGRRLALAATGLAATLALTATACGPSDDKASDKADSGTSQGADKGSDTGSDTGEAQLPGDIADRLKEHGIDPDKWKNGAWKNWAKEDWLREAKDFVNPVIDGLWKPERMTKAKDPNKTIAAKDAAADQGATDPEPSPVQAKREKTPYHENAAPVGKIFFDSPEGSMVCSGTVVKDPRNPGKSNLVWTAGHCVHAGSAGGWYRNITFVPAYNDLGKSEAELQNAAPQEIAPYGQYWADWVSTSAEWIDEGAASGGAGAPYDYAVMHVKPEQGSKSLEETVGAALDVDFTTPSAQTVSSMGAWGYPAAPPYDGQIMHKCIDKPGRLSLTSAQPTMYRIGCTMTGGSSGGGWFRMVGDKMKLVSNTSIGPAENTWLAGPQLGKGAQQVYDMMSKKYGSK